MRVICLLQQLEKPHLSDPIYRRHARTLNPLWLARSQRSSPLITSPSPRRTCTNAARVKQRLPTTYASTTPYLAVATCIYHSYAAHVRPTTKADSESNVQQLSTVTPARNTHHAFAHTQQSTCRALSSSACDQYGMARCAVAHILPIYTYALH